MKLVIEAEGVKRKLDGPFNICAGTDDLRELRDQIDLMLARWEKENCCYGWATIYPRPTGPGPSTNPLPWAEK